MGYSWQIKPKDSMVVPINQYAPAGAVHNITIGRVKELLTAKGFNAAILVQETYGGVTGYTIITNFGNVNSDLNLATDVYFNKSYKNIGFTKPKSTSVSQYWMWYIYRDESGIANQTGSAWNGWAESKTVDGIEYYVTKMTSEPTYPPIYVTTYTGNIYYHGDLPYNWQSVSSIGSHLLSSILNINSGNPVNNVSAQGNLNLVSQTEVDTLISEVVLDISKIKVTYSIPSGTYSYIKLVYKRGSVPTSVSDGTAINIAQSSTSQVIDGIADGGIYWFVIFTDVSKSNAMSVETEAVPMILWDKDLGVKHPMCSDYVSVKQNYDAYLWEFIDTYRLVGSGSNTPPGAGNTSITFQKGIKRKYATKMYIEIQCSRSYTLQWANSAMRLADTKTATGALPSGYLRVNFVSGNSSGVTDNYTHTTPYYTLPKMLIEIDISSVGADTMWYLAFWKCNEYTEITKCYFNAPVEIES